MPKDGFISRFLVPGGRYLVTRGSETLYLFDLGRVGRKPFKAPVLVARQNLKQYCITNAVALEVVAVKGDESRLRVGLGFSGDPGYGECVLFHHLATVINAYPQVFGYNFV
jgi:hypothetical protein